MRESQRMGLITAGLGKAEKASNRREYKCIHPECNVDSIKSHSQQKKSQLEAIAEDLHVFAMNKNIYQQFKSEDKELLKKKTIGDATRYKGYCNAHDTGIFSPIENGNLDINDPEHNFLLLLRAVSHEYSNKRRMHDQQNDVLSKVGHLFGERGRRSYKESNLGLGEFLKKDAPHYLSKLFDIYESKDWSQIEYNSFQIKKNIGVSSTTCFSPFREAHSDWMKKNFDMPQPFVSFNVVPDKNSTSVSFVWFSEISAHCSEFKSINLLQQNIVEIVNSYMFCESEDVCVKPSLWEKLTTAQRWEIYKHMGNSDSLPGSVSIPVVVDW